MTRAEHDFEEWLHDFEARLGSDAKRGAEDAAIRKRLRERRGSIIEFIIRWHKAHPEMQGKSADEQWRAYQQYEREHWH